jgi:hypothetical protein
MTAIYENLSARLCEQIATLRFSDVPRENRRRQLRPAHPSNSGRQDVKVRITDVLRWLNICA